MSAAIVDPRTMEFAIKLVELGWPVQPGFHLIDGKCQCDWNSCGSPGKHPRVGPDKKAIVPTVDAVTIRKHLTLWPFASLRIATGGPKSRLLGIDIDPRNGGADSFAALLTEHPEEPLPDTPEVITGGGGRHLYFRISSKLGDGLPHKADVRPGVELCFGQGLTAPPSRHASGGEYVWAPARAPWEIALAEAPEWLFRLALKEAAAGAPLATPAPGDDTTQIRKGERRRTLLRLGASMRARGVSVATIETALHLENERRCLPPWDGAELRRKMGGIASTLRRYRGPMANPVPEIQTDVGRAARLAEIFGGDVRWCGARKSWYSYGGASWSRDDARQIEAHAKELARLELTEVAAGAFKSLDEKGNDVGTEDAFGRAMQSFAGPRIRAVVDLTRSEPGVAIDSNEFDRDPHLLNCPNGTLDLRTMQLRDHDPGHLITMVTGAPYHPEAFSEQWDRALEHALPDPPVRDYFHRLCGSFLEGVAQDDIVPTIHGPTRTGKSTILRAVMAAMGNYAKATDYSTFAESNKRAGRATPELAALVGRRAVFAFEGGQGVELDAERVKRLSSGDPGTVRDLYQSEQEMHSRFAIVLVSNFRPIVKGDPALWSRLREVPFRHQVERPDPGLRDRLQQHPATREAVLAWMVRGYVAYTECGLEQPEAVTAATDEFRREADPFEMFLDGVGEIKRDAFVLNEDLQKAYADWAVATESPPLPWGSVRDRLKQRGCTAGRKHGGRGWRGIRIRSAAEQVDALVEEVSHEA